MIRLLVPGGEVIWCRQFVATVTVYDLTSGQFCAVGHRAGDDTVIGLPIYAAKTVKPKSGDKMLIAYKAREQVGIITGQSSAGISGLFYNEKMGEVLTGSAVTGQAEIISCAFPHGRIKAEIISTSGSFIRLKLQEGTAVKGMSGSPILQYGRIVAALYGMDDKYTLGIPIDIMTDSFLGRR